MTRVTIEPYTERWPREFLRVAKHVRAALGTRALRVDHIGSTAVPGLAAKDRIDVQVTVADLLDANPLAAHGFEEIVPIRDHIPPWADADSEQWRKRFFRTPAGVGGGNVHVRLAGHANERYALLFRDYLRAHRAAADAYSELKRRLAAEVRDVGRYADVKDPACDLVMLAAETWAAGTGWEPAASDA